MGIIQFNYDEKLCKLYTQFSYDLYKYDPNWIPESRRAMVTFFRPESELYRHPENQHQHFLVFLENRVVGRISAFINHELKDERGNQIGNIGLFESVKDYAVACDLFQSAISWLKTQKCISTIWGPVNFDIWHGYRLMTAGFGQNVFVTEPYNKNYYPIFFEKYGFSPIQNWHSVEINGKENLKRITLPCFERYQKFIDMGYKFIPFQQGDFQNEIYKLYPLLCDSFSDFLGYTIISPESFASLFKPFKYAFHNQFFVFIYDEKSELVGFAGAFLEISNALRAMGGRNSPIAKIKFFYHHNHVQRILFFIGGMSHKEAAKKNGLGKAGFYYIMRQILDAGFENVIIALMAQGNHSRGMVKHYIHQAQRQYTLYELKLSNNDNR